MKIEDLKEGDPVVYIPNHLLGEKTIKDYQLGIVSSKNDLYVFVKYKGAGGGRIWCGETLMDIIQKQLILKE